MEKLKKFRIDIIALILATICPYFLGVVGIGISIIFVIIYMISVEKHYFSQKLFLFLYFVGIILAFGGLFLINNISSKGIDSIGEALVYGVIINWGSILLMICPIIIFVIDNKKFIFRKNTIKIIIILVIAVCLCFILNKLITTTKISENIPTVGDFEKELIQRGFLTDNTDYRLYGIKSTNNKAISLSFEENNNDKYPLYVYSIIDFPWIIYYANKDIYAVSGKYWDYYTAYEKNSGYNEEKIIWDYSGGVISETEEINIYNMKLNRYEKGSTITYADFNYYSQNKDIENSVFIDIPCIESWGSKIKHIDRIDINSLNKLNSNSY